MPRGEEVTVLRGRIHIEKTASAKKNIGGGGRSVAICAGATGESRVSGIA